MTKDELWIAKWREVIDFMETNHRIHPNIA